MLFSIIVANISLFNLIHKNFMRQMVGKGIFYNIIFLPQKNKEAVASLLMFFQSPI